MKVINIEDKNYSIKSCPLCGHVWQDKYDFLYPHNGARWEVNKQHEKDENYIFHSNKKEPYENQWQLCCNENEGGCGLTILGKTTEDVVRKWNTRIGDKND